METEIHFSQNENIQCNWINNLTNWNIEIDIFGSLKTTKTFPDNNKLEIQQEVDSILKLNVSMREKLNQIENMNENDPIAT